MTQTVDLDSLIHPLVDGQKQKMSTYCLERGWYSHSAELRASRMNLQQWGMKWNEVAQSCLTLCNPMDYSLPGSSIHGIFQARILEWVAISFSRRSSQPRDWTRVSRIVMQTLYHLSHQGSNGTEGWVLAKSLTYCFHSLIPNDIWDCNPIKTPI